ncbi:MAG: efflux RND transporter periplasmic adaptor subunit [Sulfuriferula sp.]
MTKLTKIALGVAVLMAAGAWLILKPAQHQPAPVAAKAALSVNITQPGTQDWPINITANGNVAAWQEASIGTETSGLKLIAVYANVGDSVKRGQVLAQFSQDIPAADLSQQRAAQAEASAALTEARHNAERAQALAGTGAMSAQQIAQYETAATTAQARLDAANAALNRQQLNLQKTRITAPDDGIISARNATLGAVIPAGQSLFSLIRQHRLEWRAELTAEQLAQIHAGQSAQITLPNQRTIAARIRILAPTIDPQTRLGIAYVDIPPHSGAQAGMYVNGTFTLGTRRNLSLPASAIMQRDGHAYVYRLRPDQHVQLIQINTGAHNQQQFEILSGINAQDKVVVDGGGFLNDGDLVNVVSAKN